MIRNLKCDGIKQYNNEFLAMTSKIPVSDLVFLQSKLASTRILIKYHKLLKKVCIAFLTHFFTHHVVILL